MVYTHLQIQIKLQTNMHLSLGTNAFFAGDIDENGHSGGEHFGTEDKRIENERSSVSDTHTASYQQRAKNL